MWLARGCSLYMPHITRAVERDVPRDAGKARSRLRRAGTRHYSCGLNPQSIFFGVIRMTRVLSAWLVALSTVLLMGNAVADEIPQAVKDRLSVVIPSTPPDSLRPSAMSGLYEATYGPRVFYISGDGKYLLRGDLIDLEKRQNLTETRLRDVRLSSVNKFTNSMIVFGPEDAKHTVTVFTDINCGYCAKMHREMADYNNLGIRVRYLAYPRQGVPSETYDGMVSVWCNTDQHQAMTDAKAGRRVTQSTCDNKVGEHYRLGGALGVRGTPTIILENGDVMPGYAPAAELLKIIQEANAR